MDTVRRLCLRLIKAKVHPDVPGIRREIEAEAHLSADRWSAVQAQRIASLLEHAKNTTPYYRDILSSAPHSIHPDNALELLSNVPLLRRDTLQQRLGELVSERADKSQIFENATGGSTGNPVIFYQDSAYSSVAIALDDHVKSWIGIDPGDRVGNVWGADNEFKDLNFKEKIFCWASGVITLNAFKMKPDDMQSFYLSLKKWQPPYLRGYSSALEAFAIYCRDSGKTDLRFKGVRSAAEKLWPHQRKLIEEVFNCPVYDFYGSREINNLAAECPEERNMHLFSTYRYVEIVDDAGRRLPPGETGLIAITDLSNYAMPFIRYVNDDVGRIDACRLCPCGRPSPVLAELTGRSSDLIRLADGEIIHGEYFTHLFYGRDEVKAFQVHQTAFDRITVRLVMKSELKPKFVAELETHIKERMGEDIEIGIEQCESIPPLPSGKYRFTISDL
jgi:phenylacetate-CoA ligase